MIAKGVIQWFRKKEQLQPSDYIIERLEQAPALYHPLMEAQMQASLTYRPLEYPGKVTLLRVQRMPLFRPGEPDLGWGCLARGGVDVRMLPGGHHNVLIEPFVQNLAREIRPYLQNSL
jgi:thioesterase domain-containing protein